MIEECRACGQDVDVWNTAKGTRMAVSLEKEPGGTIELREGLSGRPVAVRVSAQRDVNRYVEHSKVCRGKREASGYRVRHHPRDREMAERRAITAMRMLGARFGGGEPGEWTFDRKPIGDDVAHPLLALHDNLKDLEASR